MRADAATASRPCPRRSSGCSPATPGGLPPALPGRRRERESTASRVVLLDAFGMRFVERHADHPLLRRLRIAPLASQFPSTTTAHVTTMHTGTPVGAHGLYEWNVYEPALDAVIIPILYAPPAAAPDGLRGSGVEIGDIVPPGTLYERLAEAGVRSVALQPSAFSPSTYDSVALARRRAAPVRDDRRRRRRARRRARASRATPTCTGTRSTPTGHLRRPGLARVRRRLRAARSTRCEAALAAAGPEALVLFTADHGQVAVDPSRVDYLEDFLPRDRPLPAHGAGRLRARRVPARRARARGRAGAASCASGWPGRAEVAQVAELEARGSLRRRSARGCARGWRTSACCPRRAGWRGCARRAGVEQRFRGHHGGLDPAECETWLGVMVRA